MRLELRRTIALLALSFAAAACGPFHHGGQPDSLVVFRNESTDQADVYALGTGGDPIRIGTVFAGRTETLRVPPTVSAANRINVIARIFANGRVVSTGPFTLGPGDSMDVTLTSDEKILSALPSRGQ
jgi:hypothetical protein